MVELQFNRIKNDYNIQFKINSNGHTLFHLTGLCGYIREKGYEPLLYVCYVDTIQPRKIPA